MPPHEYPVNIVRRTRKKASHLIVGVPAAGAYPLRWLICNAYPGFDAAGQLQRVVVCFTDCPALKRSKQRLQKSAQRRFLIDGGCEALQGFLLDRPMPIGDFERRFGASGAAYA